MVSAPEVSAHQFGITQEPGGPPVTASAYRCLAPDVGVFGPSTDTLLDLENREAGGWKFSLSMRHFFSPVLG